MHIRSIRIGAAVAALACSLAACGGSPATSGGEADHGGSDLGTIKVGVGTSPPDLTCHQFYYAKKNGFYKKRGLNVDITPFRDDQTAVRALQAGEVDVIWTGALAGMTAMQKGASMKVISATTPVLGFQLVGLKSIKRPKDMEGHKLGISAPGAVSAITPIIMLENDGGQKDKVRVASIGGSGARAAALVAKKIDVAVLNQPYVSQMGKYPFLHVIAKASDAIPKYIYAFEMASDEAIKDRPKALKAFVAASVQADKWAISNPDKAVKISHEVLPDSPVKDLKVAIDDMAKSKYWSTTGKVSQAQWDFTNKSLVDLNQLSKPTAYSKFVDTQFAASG